MMKSIVDAVNPEDVPEVFNIEELFSSMPFMEIESANGELGVDQLRRIEGQRIMKTHLPYDLWKENLEKNPNLRVILNIREPKDVLVSQFHHLRSDIMLGAFHGTWDQFFELFKAKKLPWGDYFDINVGWYKYNKGRANSLILKYEDVKKDHRGYVIKIAKFMGFELTDKAIDNVVEDTTLKTMSKSFEAYLKEDPNWNNRSNFIRKGIVGDWVNYFSKEQSDYVDAKTKEFLEPLGISFEN